MALTTSGTSTITLPVNAIFEQKFLRRAQQVCPYFMGSQPATLMKNGGTATLKWRRHEQMTPSTSALSEITTAAYMGGRSSATVSITDVTGLAAKYGQFYILTEEVDVLDPAGTQLDLADVIGEAAGRSLNQLMRNIMEGNATLAYAANVASKAAVHAAVAAGDLNYMINILTRNVARTFTPMSSGSTVIGSVPILPAYWAICHPDVAYDVSRITGFTSVEKYGQQVALAEGEFGTYSIAGRGLRFVISEDASVAANAGAALSAADLRSTGASNADVYSIVIYGQDAFGSIGLGKKQPDGTYRAGDKSAAWDIIIKDRKSGGSSDPLEEMNTIAYKFWFGGAVLNANWSRSLQVAATDLTN
jgi:N4-gp56 family major capsid protein